MPVSDHELAQAVARIAHDLAATLDWGPQRAATFAEELVGVGVSVDGWDAAWGSYAIKLAEDVQQQLHDTLCPHDLAGLPAAPTASPLARQRPQLCRLALHPGGDRHRPIRLADQQHVSQPPSNQVCALE